MSNEIKTIGSLCSGIEAGTVALNGMDYEFKWYSEIAEFPSSVLATHFPETPNLGDMTTIPDKISSEEIDAPDLICGGTPCQAFSFTGFRTGLNDERGNLTLRFIDVINANDKIRQKKGLRKTVVFWENVEGVLSDKTNAFGCLVSYLAGLENAISREKWSKAGILRGPDRNVAWRVLDAKYFGVPQQRKRLYLLAGGKDFSPENVIFEKHTNKELCGFFPKNDLTFIKEGHTFQVFREYTDCLYAAYGTKWNGNAAANNGSLFMVQDGRIRRFTPLECERLMGFPDNFTKVKGARRTARYTAIGNSWAVPVIKWLGTRLSLGFNEPINFSSIIQDTLFSDSIDEFINLDNGIIETANGQLNCTPIAEFPKFSNLKDIVTAEDVEDKLYITPTACYGILRRGKKNVNPQLKEILESISSQLSIEEIEARSSRQPRGAQSGMAKLTQKLRNQKEI